MKSLETTLEGLFKNAPNLPESWKKFLVKILPWLTLVFVILSIPAILAFLGLSAIGLPLSFTTGLNSGVNYTLGATAIIASIVLEALAIPGLFKQALSSWRLLFYSTLVGALYSLITLNIGGLILGTLISLYLLFQIKSHYK